MKKAQEFEIVYSFIKDFSDDGDYIPAIHQALKALRKAQHEENYKRKEVYKNHKRRYAAQKRKEYREACELKERVEKIEKELFPTPEQLAERLQQKIQIQENWWR